MELDILCKKFNITEKNYIKSSQIYYYDLVFKGHVRVPE